MQVLNARAGGKPKEEGGEEEEEEEEDFFGEPNTHLGENMTALAIPGRVLEAPKGTQQLPLPKERVSVILNFGIIDILQEYNISKQIEHNWKVRTPARRRGACAGLAAALTLPVLLSQSVVRRQNNISSVDPHDYAERFKAFMNGVFS